MKFELRIICFVFLIGLCLVPSAVMAATKITCDGVYTYDELDVPLMEGKTYCSLNADVNSTKTLGNVTSFDKTFTLQSNGHTILLNNTLRFNGVGKTVTFADAARFQYDPDGTNDRFLDASLIKLDGTSMTITTNGNPVLSAGSFSKTGINVSGNSNNLGAWEISGSSISPIVNVSGSQNQITLSSSSTVASSLAAAKGINLVGDSNTISFNTTNITAAGGKVWLESTASGNTLSDTGFVPVVYIYNGTAVKNTYAWYFFNESWSPSGLNQNMTINVTHCLPLAGNVGISANFTNMSGTVTDQHTNTSLDVVNGYSGGLLFNYTKNTVFYKFPAEIPVNITFGDNSFGSSYQEFKIGTVVVLNFDPVHSVTMPSGMQFNETQTTNWSTIPDFTAASNLRFVAEDAATHTLRGNLSFSDILDLTDPTTGSALQNLGNNLNIASAGNSIDLIVSSAGMSAFNKKAILTVYPTGFNFASGNDIKITATTDAGTSYVLYNKGIWLDKAGFVATGDDVTIGSGWIRLPVQHFSKYDFGEGSSGSGSSSGSSTSGNGGSSDPPGMTSVSKTKDVVNVGGGSAVTSVEAVGTNLGKNLVITARPVSPLPSTIKSLSTPVYQYISITTSTIPGTLSQAILSFNVPKSWLSANALTKGDIVMMHYVNGQWQALETRFISENADSVRYEAISPSFSYFAIAYQQNGTNMSAVSTSSATTAVVTMSSDKMSSGMNPTTPRITVASITTTQTTVASSSLLSPPVEGTPISIMVVTGILGVAAIIMGAFLVHRRSVRRQNPTLFDNSR
ncbi:hypothetical protein Metfor_2063 [Methanoregula formicica SMSP]|uniref:PGF-pre-PGF domain-containing protein n=2 Tax=Methanoregula formicica TaxID=882104 RepID=L0HJ09_METFS|nr:hypothetical protein Metfor_2063 [Methanoregula formicica SMSP]